MFLLLEYDDSLRFVLNETLAIFSIHCHGVGTLADAFTYLASNKPDGIILDLSIHSQDGVKLVWECQRLYKPIPPILVMSTLTNVEEFVKDLPIHSWIKKPFDLPELESKLLNIVNQNKTVVEVLDR